MEAEWRGMLEGLARQAVELGHLRADLAIEQFVWEFCGVYLGQNTSQRFLRRPDAEERAPTTWRALVEGSKPGGGKRARLK